MNYPAAFDKSFVRLIGHEGGLCWSWQSAVVGLLLRGRPSAVARLIISVVINAVKGRALWPKSHVLNKRLKAVGPSTANGDPAPTIGRVILSRFIEASILHAAPASIRKVLDGSLFGPLPSGDAMRFRCQWKGDSTALAAATRGIASTEIIESRNGLLSTVAPTKPITMAAVPAIQGFCGQMPKSLTNYVYRSTHAYL